MKTSVIAAIIVGILVVGGVVAFVVSGDDSSDDTNTQQPVTSIPQTNTNTDQQSNDQAAAQPETNQTTFTVAEVATRNTENDCWSIINGGVYDLTSYIPRHPGGDEILLACGTDGTSLFFDRETADGESVGSGTPHSSRAESQLASLKIGDLAN